MWPLFPLGVILNGVACHSEQTTEEKCCRQHFNKLYQMMKNIMFSCAAKGETMNLDLDSGSSREWSKKLRKDKGFQCQFSSSKNQNISPIWSGKKNYLQIFLILFLIIPNFIRNCFEPYWTDWNNNCITTRVFTFATISSRRKLLLMKSWPKISPENNGKDKKIAP